ncbi:MAG: Methionyl-tRNA formyltransferase [uncultured Gemmatimonadetes bacterium]|uniref:Methionyl-tRNA formyltransferase n=1 Tax=uncultured Gemmatimonadota bacterium TaxID=203437 RepID=A0A6J4KG27_9BACT|nr:MAG: Methionyl-tRNA formyltransferase [uncultured Gemmatimonadota bacterium]
MRIVFWGTPEFAVPALRAIADEGHDVAGVVTQPDRPAGRGRGVAQSAVKREALEMGVPVLQPERARGDEFMAALRALEPELSVVVAYGQILKPEVLELPPLGSINIHASLLPELRGAAPIQWAIARGCQTTGVTIMRMEAGLDSGPMLIRAEEPILPDDSGTELARRLSAVGAEAVVEALALIESGQIEEEVQDHSRATYAPKIERETARIDWTLPAEEAALFIRGMDDVPGAWTPHGARGAVKLFRPQPRDESGEPGCVLAVGADGVLVACGIGAVMIREVQPPGKRRMAAGDWVRGRGVSIDDQFGAEA